MHDINWYAISTVVEGIGLLLTTGTLVWKAGRYSLEQKREAKAMHAKLDQLLTLTSSQQKELTELRKRMGRLNKGLHSVWGAVQQLRGRVSAVERSFWPPFAPRWPPQPQAPAEPSAQA
jgi:hypothetical protein